MKKISCLTVTQEGRLDCLQEAIADYMRQTYEHKELVLVHASGDVFDKQLSELVSPLAHQNVRFYRLDQGTPLGEMRNATVRFSRGDVICIWDDDDRNHSQRLELQYQYLNEQSADVCFFTDQMHLFVQSNELFWNDWAIEVQPRDLVQSTMMVSRDKMLEYKPISKREDEFLVYDLVNAERKIARLSDHGYLHLYQYTGNNTYGFEHHGNISARKRFRRDRILQNIEQIKSALTDFGISKQTFEMPCDESILELNSHNENGQLQWQLNEVPHV